MGPPDRLREQHHKQSDLLDEKDHNDHAREAEESLSAVKLDLLAV